MSLVGEKVLAISVPSSRSPPSSPENSSKRPFHNWTNCKPLLTTSRAVPISAEPLIGCKSLRFAPAPAAPPPVSEISAARAIADAAAPSNAAVATPPLLPTRPPPLEPQWFRANLDAHETDLGAFSVLPHEAMCRVLELLTPQGTLQAERVCHSWRTAIHTSLPFWRDWRSRGATLSEATLTIPGVTTYAYGSPPAEVPAETRAAAAFAASQASDLPASSLELAACASSWTVLRMEHGGGAVNTNSSLIGNASGIGSRNGGNGQPPAALRQHQARDYLLSACAPSGLVFSGDKEAALRVWGARTGELLARVPLPGASMSSLASQLGRVIVGDAQGHVHVLTTAALLRGEVDCVTFRAHDGKAATLHCRTYDEMLLTGGGDGWVRKWSCDRIGEQARLTRRRHQDRLHAMRKPSVDHWYETWDKNPGSPHLKPATPPSSPPKVAEPPTTSSSRVDLGLWAVSEARALTRHIDTVVALTRDDEYAYSGSREGHVQITLLSDGTPHHRIDSAGVINCLAAHRGKLVLCYDDGQQATLQIWDAVDKRLVQEVSGIRKWNAPTSITYLGYEKCFWVRDATICTMTW